MICRTEAPKVKGPLNALRSYPLMFYEKVDGPLRDVYDLRADEEAEMQRLLSRKIDWAEL